MKRRLRALPPLLSLLLLATACTSEPDTEQLDDRFTIVEDPPRDDLADAQVQRLFTPDGAPVDPAHIIEPEDSGAPPPPPGQSAPPAEPAEPGGPISPAGPAAPAAPAAPAGPVGPVAPPRVVADAAPAPAHSPRLYLRSPVPPGQGAPRELSWKIQDLADHGFSRLDIKISAAGQNAAAQFPVTSPDTPPQSLSMLSWRAYGLNLAFENQDSCELTWFFTDETGRDIPFEDEQTGHHDSCADDVPLIIPQAGNLALNLTVHRPGFEPVTLVFSILAVE